MRHLQYLFNIYEVNSALILISQTRRHSALSMFRCYILYCVHTLWQCPLSRVLARVGNLKAGSIHLPQVLPVSTPEPFSNGTKSVTLAQDSGAYTFCTCGEFRIGQWHSIITISYIIWPIFGYGNWRPCVTVRFCTPPLFGQMVARIIIYFLLHFLLL